MLFQITNKCREQIENLQYLIAKDDKFSKLKIVKIFSKFQQFSLVNPKAHQLITITPQKKLLEKLMSKFTTINIHYSTTR